MTLRKCSEFLVRFGNLGEAALLRAIIAVAVGAFLVLGVVYWIGKDMIDRDMLAASLQGAGRGANATLDRLVQIAERGAQEAKISPRLGGEIVARYTRVGIDSYLTERLVSATKAYAQITNQSVMGAADDIANGFEEPIYGMQSLNRGLSFLDATTRHKIESLVKQGRTGEAREVLLMAFLKVVH